MLSVRAGRAGKVFSYTHAMKSDLSSSSDVGMSGSANHHVAGRPAVLDNVETTTEFTAKEYATSVHKSSEVSTVTVKECKESLHNSSEVQSTQVASSPPLRHTSQDLGCVSKLSSKEGQDMLAMDENDDVAKDMLVEKSTAYLSCLLNDVQVLFNRVLNPPSNFRAAQQHRREHRDLGDGLDRVPRAHHGQGGVQAGLPGGNRARCSEGAYDRDGTGRGDGG